MDKTSWFGIILGVFVLVGGLILKGADPIALYNPAALVIIFLGTIAAISIAFPLNELKRVPALFRVIFSNNQFISVKELIPMFSQWTQIARKEGLLALEKVSDEIEDPFLQRGIRMLVDGQSHEYIREMMEEEIMAMEERHRVGAKIFSQAGTYAPTLGVLGAVVGLVSALGHLEDISLLGKSISSAFIATLFGIFTGYVLWHPFANKLIRKSEEEVRIKQIMIEGLLAVQEGLPARTIEEKLLSYLPANERNLEKEPELEKVGASVEA